MEYVIFSLVAVSLVFLTLVALAVWEWVAFGKEHEHFHCRIARRTSRRWRRRDEPAELRWHLLPCRAAWVGTALLLRSGPLSLRALIVPISLPAKAHIVDETRSTVRRLGFRPKTLAVTCPDGAPMIVAVKESDRAKLVGPFVAAAIAGLPTPPRPRRHRTS